MSRAAGGRTDFSGLTAAGPRRSTLGPGRRALVCGDRFSASEDGPAPAGMVSGQRRRWGGSRSSRRCGWWRRSCGGTARSRGVASGQREHVCDGGATAERGARGRRRRARWTRAWRTFAKRFSANSENQLTDHAALRGAVSPSNKKLFPFHFLHCPIAKVQFDLLLKVAIIFRTNMRLKFCPLLF